MNLQTHNDMSKTQGQKLREKLNLEATLEKRLDRLMEAAGFPKSLDTFPRRLEALDKALQADKTQNLAPEQRLHWMHCLAVGPIDSAIIERISALRKAGISQARKAAGSKGLKTQEKETPEKRKRRTAGLKKKR